MRKTIIFSLITLVAAAMLFGGCGNVGRNVHINEKDISAFDSVHVNVSSANIEFTASDRYGLEIFVPERYRPEWDVTNGQLTIYERTGGFRFVPHFSFSKCYVKVYYPVGAEFHDISLRSSSGNIEFSETAVSDLNITASSGAVYAKAEKCASAYIKTKSGDVKLSGSVDDVDISTSSGAVRSDTSGSGAIRAITRSGSVTLGCEGDRPAALNVSTSSGSIRADGAVWRDVRTTTRSGSTEIRGELSGDTYVKTSSGDVKLSVSGDPSQYGYSLTPSSGSIHWDGMKMGKPARSSGSFENNITVDTSSGGIRVDFSK